MGYRISLYRCPKEDVDALRNLTDEDIKNTDFDFFKVLEKDEIKYDTLANVLDTGDEEKNNLCSRLFINRLELECDYGIYTISREQLLNIIEYIRKNNIYDWMMNHSVEYDEKKMGAEIGKGNIRWGEQNWDDAVREVCINARHDAEEWNLGWKNNGKQVYMNIDTSDNKWWISDGISYKYAIFNFIHILKIFDWENDYLVAIGG